MPRYKQKFRMYRALAAEAQEILEEARKAAEGLGLATAPAPNRGTPEASRPDAKALDHIRVLVKQGYGDDYDCCFAASPSIALWAACQASFAEAQPHPGAFTPRCITPRQKSLAIPATALPPKYKHWHKLGGQPQRQAAGFDIVVVPLQGAIYANHGVSNTPVSMVASANPEASLEALAASVETQAPFLAGIYSQGPSTPGCGFGTTEDDGIQVLHKGLGELAAEFDVPHVIDQTCALPFVPDAVAEPGTSVTVYGHRALGGLGLIIGSEDLVSPLQEVLGAQDVAAGSSDPPALMELLEDLAGGGDKYSRNLGRLYDAVTGELGQLDSQFKKDLRVRKDTASMAVEVNYEDTWHDGLGVPIFTTVDSENGVNLMETGIAAMGLSSITVLEASVMIHLPISAAGRLEADGDRAALDVKGLGRLLEILGRRSGYLS